MLERIDDGDATPMDIEIMAQVQSNIIGNCLCVLGDSMAMPIGSMIEQFRPEFERHMEEARRRNGIDLNGLEPAPPASDDHSGPMPTIAAARATSDKGGECPLQDITCGWGAGRSRFIEPKRHFRKPLELSPLVAIDRERCILCYRCVRFSQEISEDFQLVFLERADHTYVGTHDGRPYVAPFSGNIVELCPVGALTSSAYRFRARPWDVEQAGTVCTLCPSQCNIQFTVRDDAKVLRVMARDNA